MNQLKLTASPSPAPTPTLSVDHYGHENGRFLQRPVVQNVLPFFTSLSVHAGVLIFGLMVFGAVNLVQMPPTQVQIVIPDSPFTEDAPIGGVPNVGLHDDPLRPPMQNNDVSFVSANAFNSKSVKVEVADSGAQGAASMIGPGFLTRFGNSNGSSGTDGGGPLAMFGGAPGGGAPGSQSWVFCNCGSNARRIVYLCDATGSMINKMATLKDELNKSVVRLRPTQSFDVIFYQDVRVDAMAQTLLPASPVNKRKAALYCEGICSGGTTDPIPSLIFALKLKPQLIYFLTDAADFPDTDALLAAIKKYNINNQTKISTILFVENKAEHDADSEGLMKKIAQESGGHFRWVEMDELP